ncbi:13090_t:CDS:2 [Dentiscutata heterogama]|uniref:13090_t:CDS:1 n=1 Tax=Dentiscutata heterogama TaxID=1316150 RepID=A0ACA9M546_9GLOM|nr:13090_t:CDS:2 [Dentiscutata heterogama]
MTLLNNFKFYAYHSDMSIAGSVHLEKTNKSTGPTIIFEDENIQSFEGLDFRIKLMTIPGYRNSARLLILSLENDEKDIPVPDGIRVVDVTDFTNPRDLSTFPGTNVFLIEHLYKYQIFYNHQSIYQIYSKKKFTIHNDRKILN